MAAIANLVLTDAAGTPVNHTFGPVNVDPQGVAHWADRSGGIALGFPTANFSLRPPNKQTRNYKLTLKVVTPVLEVTSPSTSTGIQPAPTKAYDLTAVVEMVLPERSTLQQRKDLAAFMRDYLSEAIITSAIENFEAIY
jgi:hypothetical protein